MNIEDLINTISQDKPVERIMAAIIMAGLLANPENQASEKTLAQIAREAQKNLDDLYL